MRQATDRVDAKVEASCGKVSRTAKCVLCACLIVSACLLNASVSLSVCSLPWSVCVCVCVLMSSLLSTQNKLLKRQPALASSLNCRLREEASAGLELLQFPTMKYLNPIKKCSYQKAHLVQRVETVIARK